MIRLGHLDDDHALLGAGAAARAVCARPVARITC
jgi:hypothetical protein